MNYQCKTVQIPPAIRVQSQKGTEAATYLQGMIEDNTKQGWEFYSVESIGVIEDPGCIQGLLGAKSAEFVYYVVVFRKATN